MGDPGKKSCGLICVSLKAAEEKSLKLYISWKLNILIFFVATKISITVDCYFQNKTKIVKTMTVV